MIRDLAVIAPVVMGSLCLLAVCAVYLRSQRFRLDGALLALCGVVLLGLSYWQVGDDADREQGRRLDALALLEGHIARIADEQARLAMAISGDAPSAQEDGTAPPTAQAGYALTTAAVAAPATVSRVLEVEALGGVSGEELAAIVTWIRRVHQAQPSARIVVEPVMPLTSTDPAGQRRRLMDVAGSVIDHVFEELNRRVDIQTMVSESIPGPRIRLQIADA